MTCCQNNSQVCGNTQIRHHPKNSVHLSRRVKSCFCCSFDGHRMILQHWVPRGQTVNGAYYANVLKTHLRGAMRKKRPDLIKKQWFLLQDNARPHIAAVALAALTEIGGTALQHPPYSSDLAPCDFWAFPTLKHNCAERGSLQMNNLFHVFESFTKRCKKYIQCEGRYFEKEKIVGLVESSDSE